MSRRVGSQTAAACAAQVLDALKAGAQPTTVGAVTQQARAALLMQRARRAAGAQRVALPHLRLYMVALRTYG